MAFANLLLDNSYARIEHIDFSKQRHYCNCVIAVYSDSQLTKFITQLSQEVRAINTAISYYSIITDEESLLDMALIPSKAALICIENPTSDYAKSVNNRLIYKDSSNIIKLDRPSFIYDEVNKTYLMAQGDTTSKYKEFSEIYTTQQFDSYFTVDSAPIAKMYTYLKTLPLFAKCPMA